MNDYIKRQTELRAAAWEQAKALLDHAASEGRDLDAAEQESYDRMTAELDKRSAAIDQLVSDFEREARAAELRLPEATATPVREDRSSDDAMLRKLLKGEVRGHVFERRNTATPMSTSADAELVPQDFYGVIQEILRYTGPAFQPGLYTILNTQGGNDIKVPRQTAFSAATAIAEGAAAAVSNPTGESFTLKALKVNVLLRVSSELIADAGVPLVEYLGRQAGEAVGYKANQFLAVGTGTVEPRGIFTASTLGKTGGTAVAGAFTADDLIDLAHSVDSAVAMRPAVAFQMNRATLGAVRKLKDSDGRYLFDYSSGSEPTILGYRVVENPFAPAIGTAARSVVFGDHSSYHVRTVGGIEVARSDDFAFDTDEVVFRVGLRVWGDLGQGENVKHFIGGAS